MQRHRGLAAVSLLLLVGGVASWFFSRKWEGWEYILDIVGKGDNMPIAGLIPIIAFFTYLSMNEAFRHDRLIKQGREDEILDESKVARTSSPMLTGSRSTRPGSAQGSGSTPRCRARGQGLAAALGRPPGRVLALCPRALARDILRSLLVE
jgi:hypothetical protein